MSIEFFKVLVDNFVKQADELIEAEECAECTTIVSSLKVSGERFAQLWTLASIIQHDRVIAKAERLILDPYAVVQVLYFKCDDLRVPARYIPIRVTELLDDKIVDCDISII